MLDATNERKTRLGWLRTDTRRQYNTAVLMYKILNLRVPSYLHEMFERRQLVRPARGNNRDLMIAKVQTAYGQGSFRAQGVNLWNSLPEHVKYQPSVRLFKSTLRDNLFTLD